mmetsp:Transcript_47323/g.112480  ORF Transcript_47323/g.112480 Transcript_47323/m.112480 type:complete len:689 (+) Transcript_47323:19-2085(+)
MNGGMDESSHLTKNLSAVSLGEEWVDVCFAIGDHPILKNVTGMAQPGKLTGVMGPSGSGKTTLLNVLSGRQRLKGYSRTGNDKQEVHFSGDIYARGRPVSTSYFRGKTAYVFQDNALMDSDTPRECLEFSAYLRLSRNVSKSQRNQLVEKLLVDLHLEDAATVIVGGPLRKGLSGGQQKRVAVGVELISNPQMIFLDEPISGLDSYNAFTLMHTLHKLARTGVPVVLTIHQPSSEIYDLIDDVIFLAKGEVVYQGPRPGLFHHFDQLGFHCPANHCPADFVMFLIQKEGEEVIEHLTSSWRTSTSCKQLMNRISHAGDYYNPEAARTASRLFPDDSESSEEDNSSDSDSSQKVFGQPKRKRNCFQAQWALIRRDGRRVWRDKKLILSANIQNLIVSLVYGWLFLGAGRQEYREVGFSTDVALRAGVQPCDDAVLSELPGARDVCLRMFQVHWGALSIVAINAMMGSITWAITVFQNERSCFLREASSGYYNTFSYFLSKSVFEFPVIGMTVVVSILTVYWLMGLNANPLVLMLEVLMLSVASSSIVFCLSAQASTAEQAYALAPIAQIPQFAFAGILLPNEMVPLSLRWLKWLCPLYYGMTMMALSEFDEPIEQFQECQAQLNASASDNLDALYAKCPGATVQVMALRSQGVFEGYFWWPAATMCCVFFVAFRLLGVLILWRKSRFVH